MDSQVVPYQQEHVKHYADGVVPDSSYSISTSTSFEQNCIRASLSINSLAMASGIQSSQPAYQVPTAKETESFTLKTSSMSDIGGVLSSTRTVSRSSEHLIIQQPLTSNMSAHRYRRKSVESEVRLRRHSLAQPRSMSTVSPRQRRLSHDARDNPREILHGLQCVASRKRSSSSANAI